MQSLKKKKKKQLIYKPYLKGNWHSGTAALRGLRILGYYAAFAVVYFLMGAFLQLGQTVFRWIVCTVVVGVCFMIVYASGANDGESEAGLGEIAYAHEQAGQQVTRQERDRCFHPLKGWFSFAVAAAVLLLICVPYALTAQKQVYDLQALPTWLGSFQGHEEITAPLAYYQRDYSMTATGVLGLIVRLILFPIANAVGGRNADGMLLMDRLSPLLALIPALGYPLGYLSGPRRRAAVHGDIHANIRRRQRREKKARQARAEKKNELI